MSETYFDIFDEHDIPSNKIASYDEVFKQGLWVRGVHIIIYTPDEEIVMQKRAPSLKSHPDEIEISVGGGVDAGETPEQAILREVKEELGIILDKNNLRFLGKRKYNHHTKNQIIRNFIYSYAACVSKDQLQYRANPDETSAIFLISKRKLRLALVKHRIKHVGRITSQYVYWNYLLKSM